MPSGRRQLEPVRSGSTTAIAQGSHTFDVGSRQERQQRRDASEQDVDGLEPPVLRPVREHGRYGGRRRPHRNRGAGRDRRARRKRHRQCRRRRPHLRRRREHGSWEAPASTSSTAARAPTPPITRRRRPESPSTSRSIQDRLGETATIEFRPRSRLSSSAYADSLTEPTRLRRCSATAADSWAVSRATTSCVAAPSGLAQRRTRNDTADYRQHLRR